ncbi:MAG: hypothetical protein AUH78_20595 [Gemmatimonadetes bacterium 13_1_40CM_4_69_8]|uniref:MMPL family transporter n=1 Tax=Candidatus Segetimicrobium genomatis TaxID=2569760 RepID=A0A537IRH0_9BACT|nr:MAG: hypothetical protein AUH78_20595 [Gemmatimonadetes bacterium 13_1_40CM_4_69_8]TMI73904.1 MAG: MMPL family transporter [Terrabacteria group bacterium ANGP1]
MQESKSRSHPTAWVVRYRVWVVAGWALTVLALAPRAARVDRFLAVAPPVGGEAVVVDAELAARFVSPFVNYVILIVGGGPQPVEPRGRALLDSILACVGRVPGVLRVRSYETPRDTLFFVPGHEATFVVVGLDGLRHTPEDVVLELRRATSALLPALSERFPSLTLRWTGRAALNADLRQASSADVSAAERRALPLTLLVLVAAFGTLLATLLPVASGALVITIALGLATLVGARWPLATLAQSFIAMIGLGLGIDYALLMVSRFRESLGAGLSPDAAACDAARTAGRTIMLSGAAVAVGFAALLAIPHSELKAAAVGGLLSAATAVLLSISLVPALLSWIGSGIDRGRLWPARWALRTRSAWHRWGRWIVRRPIQVLVAAGVPVVVLAWQGHRLRPGLPRGGEWLPSGIESATALRELEAMGRSGVVQTIHVLMQLPAGHDVLTRDGWAAVRRMRRWLVADQRIAAVHSFTSFAAVRPLSRLAFFTTPRSTWRPFLAEDRRSVLLHAVPAESADAVALVAFVERLRALDAERFTGLAGTRILVGGLPASRADYVKVVQGRFGSVVTLVLLGTFAALFVGLRSVLVPVKAIALNLLAVGSGFGAVVLAFQDGWGLGVFGLREPVDRVFLVLPTIVFCTVFGLSMDYEVFLVTRVAEAARNATNDSTAVVEGLANTGPVITSAAAIMVAVFGAFMLGDFLLIKMLGLALAVAVFADATFVRSAVGPALLTLAGRWNWWPGRTPP